MPITPEKYIRKPLVVVGVEVTEDNFMELALWVQGSIMNIDGSESDVIDPKKQFILVRVHNPKSPRQSRAFVGDWILYSDRGYKVYSPKAFKNTFDPVNTEFKRDKAEKEMRAKRAQRDEEEKTQARREEMLDQEKENWTPRGLPAEQSMSQEELDDHQDKDGPVLTRDAKQEAEVEQARVELADSDYDE